MRAFAVLAALAGCREVHETEPPPAPDAVVANFRVATFNVRRFFDPVCDSGACGNGDYEYVPTPAQFEARATQIADAIRALDADVVVLEEIETQACLDALSARLADVMPYAVLGEIGYAASVDVAIVSRTPFDSVTPHRASEPATNYSREFLEVHTHSDAVIFAAHFKAKANDDPARRLAEAQTSARLVDARGQLEPDALVVLAGDLNDVPGSPPLDALTIGGGLTRVADDLPIANQATYFFDGDGQAIDHILLAPGRASLRVPKSSRVWRDSSTSGWGGSDHAALSSDFAQP